MKTLGLLLSLLMVVGTVAAALADSDNKRFRARLSGFEEVPAVSSTGSGKFLAKVSKDKTSLEFELSYEDLEGTTTAAAHIHLGQKGVNGGVIAFLCGGGGKPACTPGSGTFTGTIDATNVMAMTPDQGIAQGEFAEVLRALRAGVVYANVHTNKHPGGEIRGQVRGRDDNDDDD